MIVNEAKKEVNGENIRKESDQSSATEQMNKDRRAILRKIAVGTAALAGCSVLPEKWTLPIVEFGILPAHATTSGETIGEGYDNQLTISYTGAKISVDGILQDKFVFPELGPSYGKSFLIVWSDGNELFVPDSKHMTLMPAPDARKYQPGGVYSENNPDIPTMEVYSKRGTHPGTVTLHY